MIHTFLKSIGFSELCQNKELYQLVGDIIRNPDERAMDQDTCGNEIACFIRYVENDMGICVCGGILEENQFQMEYYFPFFRGSGITTMEPAEIERHASSESFFGICDELKMGIPLIFYVNNVADVFREYRHNRQWSLSNNTVLSALACNGKILLPIMKTKEMAAMKRKSSEKRMNLMMQARDGDRSAMENLTLSDMDLYSTVSQRAMKEDILSIVESSIIPYGVETDQYTIIGEILTYYMVKNTITRENVWIMTLLCNDMKFDVCINERDLLGEPEIGRRFKGRVWMQGYLNFGY
ncbi:MAG: DUF3881 family protein [Clostridiales bacterium]|nr:DUF3881 family protein [Clostridiales bacterium]